ncbi:helix-turn-helix DNA-binding domain protein [Mycobacterium phage Charm]|nr:helix-turn-helix DNA-binding domain protein [Mycobacterium phage Charm]
MSSTGTTYSPENPRDWDPNHPLLKSRGAPYETPAFMRFHRAGYSGQFIMRAFKVGARTLSQAFERAMDEENTAARQRRDIHCPTTNPEKKQGKKT